MDMAQNADKRISIRASRAQKKVLEETAKAEGRTLSNWGLRAMLAYAKPSSSGSHSTK